MFIYEEMPKVVTVEMTEAEFKKYREQYLERQKKRPQIDTSAQFHENGISIDKGVRK